MTIRSIYAKQDEEGPERGAVVFCSAVSDGGGLIQAAVGSAGGCGRRPLKRVGEARNATSRVAWRTLRKACAWP